MSRDMQRGRSQRMEVGRVFVAIAVFLTGSPAFAEDGGEIESLKQELGAVKQQYEQRIESLESRLKALEAHQAEGQKAEQPDAMAAAQLQVKEDIAPRTAVEAQAAPPSWAKLMEGFEYGGYVRSGFGVNGKGGDMDAFQAPGADAKYRLGNEAETYGELVLAKFFETDPAGPDVKTQVRLGYVTENDNVSDSDDQFRIKESFVEMGDFSWAPDVKFWAGERYYHRYDIHINDFFYLDMSGYGGGVEDIPVGDLGKFGVAYIGGSDDNYLSNVGRRAESNLDLRLYDVNVPLGHAMFWVDLAHAEGGTTTTGIDYPQSDGFATGLVHTSKDVFGIEGAHTASIEFGRGTAADFSAALEDPVTSGLNQRWQTRITDSTVFDFNEQWSLMYALVYQLEDRGTTGDSEVSWYSAGVRPIYYFNKNIGVALEGGVDYVNDKTTGRDDALFKLTIAPELRMSNKFFSRPVLRAYATYAAWGGDFQGLVGGNAYRNDTHGFSYGLQMETWW